jgi:Ca2+-binding RTX toxin-like protein
LELAPLGSGSDSVLAAVEGYTLAANVEHLILAGAVVAGNGGIGANTVTGNASANSLSGGAGGDRLAGLAGADTLLGESGNDTLLGGNDADSLLGGAENDSLLGEAGDDRLFGETGNDTLLGGDGSDTLDGGTGVDSLLGGAGDDFYTIEILADAVVEVAGGGTDSVLANINGYTLTENVEVLILGAAIAGYGNSGANTLVGSANGDLLVGNGGNDSISGGGGGDRLQGANAATLGRGEIDTLTGGAGVDVFVLGNSSGVFYNDGILPSPGTADYALITDFTPGQDILALKGSAANYSLGEHGLIGLSGTGLFLVGSTNELVAVIQSAGAAATPANTINTASFS